MACQVQDNDAMAAVELIAEHGLEGLGDAVSLLTNEAMRLERKRWARRCTDWARYPPLPGDVRDVAGAHTDFANRYVTALD